MPLVTQHGKTSDPRSGHSLTTTHVVNTATPPVTVYMTHAGRLLDRRRPSPDAACPPADIPCPDCGHPLSFGSWPFCPH